VFYSIIQERATNEVYQRTANRADSLGAKALAVVARRVATDEAAHYAFFLEMGRLLLFLFPDESLGALSKVLKTFTMPAADIIDDYDVFVDALYRERLFGRVIYAREVVRSVLSATKTHLDRDEERTLTLDIESLRDVVLRITDVRYGQT
jgi:acyl-[acyl-carrier-protein] desaturase